MPMIELIALTKKGGETEIYIETDKISAVVVESEKRCNVHMTYMSGSFAIGIPALDVMALMMDIDDIVRPDYIDI